MIWVDHKTASSGAAAFSLPAPHYGVALVAFAEHQAERLMVALGEVKTNPFFSMFFESPNPPSLASDQHVVVDGAMCTLTFARCWAAL